MELKLLGDAHRPFIHYCAPFAGLSGTVALVSGGSMDCSRYSLLGIYPYASLRSRGSNLTLECEGRRSTHRGNPFEYLESIFGESDSDTLPEYLPFAGGAMGYLGYELGGFLEKLPVPKDSTLALPDLCLFFPSIVLIRDRVEQQDYLLQSLAAPAEAVRTIRRMAAGNGLPAEFPGRPVAAMKVTSNFTREGYLAAVEQVRRHIHAGDIYQANLSQRFRCNYPGEAFPLFARLLAANPASFFAFLNEGGSSVLSSSPERFLFRRGEIVESRPIKGTRPRSLDPAQDKLNRQALLSSPKDDAELSMIVDLVRNDLGRVCVPGSVRVQHHKLMESYRNVHHLVSVVTGRLTPAENNINLIRALFPAGSITGCPKIRAMEIINDLEPYPRGVYTGAIGYLGWHQNLDLNVAIRTAVLKNDTLRFSVGGGIVYDSDPEAEYLETLHKGETFFKLLGVKI